ncbi:ROK family protein [Spongiactinospora sp. TRM90649]|uniref:ROK family protein n=1 Tax=Spongiactinospora sp. TRM90649 TaxID=3031114 RepID=UPI0023F62EFE|nr:ROK family protein [Spongiactinospora sp. TRM90649]MDF5755429.1 ROK family protein [Spongiactinospora sp. TRM90649]
MSAFVVALDVGGTSMKGGVVTPDGVVLHTEHRPTPRAEGPDAVVAAIRAFIDHLSSAAPDTEGAPAGVGLAVPGLVTPDTAVYSANIGWRQVPASAFTSAPVPVQLGHDVRTGGLAESVLGAGRGVADFLFLPIGTGIAGASILNGEPYAGAEGWGGEIGHTPVYPDGEACACGQRGCLETYASAASVARRYASRTGLTVDTEEVAARAATGDDPAATEVWNDAIEALSLSLATYSLLLDPSLIVIGGGLAEAGPTLLAPLADRLAAHLTFRPAPPLRPAALGPQAGMLGAALLGWQAAGHPTIGTTWTPKVPNTTPVP